MAKPPIVEMTRTWPESVWHLAENPIWNVPTDNNDVHFEIGTTAGPFASINHVRGLAVLATGYDRTDDPHPFVNRMQIIGVRSLDKARQSGYDMLGTVRGNGRKYRAFTSSALFERADKSLVNVAILYCCEPKDKADIGAGGFTVGNNPLSQR